MEGKYRGETIKTTTKLHTNLVLGAFGKKKKTSFRGENIKKNYERGNCLLFNFWEFSIFILFPLISIYSQPNKGCHQKNNSGNRWIII